MDNITYFNDIYCLNSVLKKDKTFCSYPTYLQYALCWKYLQISISYFIDDCNYNLENYTPYYEQSYTYMGDGIEVEYELSPAPTIIAPDLYVAKRVVSEDEDEESYFVELSPNEYEYDPTTNIITFKTAPEDGADVKIVAYQDGYFLESLGIKEKNILAEGMNIPFLESNQNNTQLMTQIIYGGSMKIYSQAEHMKQVHNIVQSQRDWVRELIVNYSYRSAIPQFGNPKLQNLVGLGGARTRKYSSGR